MTATVNEILDEMVEESVDPRFVEKVKRMKKRMSESELARWLFDRGALPTELHRKYGLNRVLSNVSASEIPEEAPEYVGDENTAGTAGLDTPPLTPASVQDDEEFSDVDEDDDEVEEGDDLTPKSPKSVLQDEAANRGLPTSGTRQELFDRIVAHDQGVED